MTASGACTTLAGVLADVTPSQTQTGAASQTPTLTNVLLHMYRLKKTGVENRSQNDCVTTSTRIGLQRIRGFLNDMRYINPRFTYLLTYLLTTPLPLALAVTRRTPRRAGSQLITLQWKPTTTAVNQYS